MKRIFVSLLSATLVAFSAISMAQDGPVQPVDCSGSITTGGTAQNALATSNTLRGFCIANIDTSEVMWISFTGTAAPDTAGSFPLAPATATTYAGLVSFCTPPGFRTSSALSVRAATTGHKFSCFRW